MIVGSGEDGDMFCFLSRSRREGCQVVMVSANGPDILRVCGASGVDAALRIRAVDQWSLIAPMQVVAFGGEKHILDVRPLERGEHRQAPHSVTGESLYEGLVQIERSREGVAT